MKPTTVTLDEQRAAELERLATERKQTLSSLVDELLREGLERSRAPRQKKTQLDLPSFDMGRPTLNVADRNRLMEFLDGR